MTSRAGSSRWSIMRTASARHSIVFTATEADSGTRASGPRVATHRLILFARSLARTGRRSGPLVLAACSAFHHSRFDPAGDRGEDLGGPLLFQSAHAANVGGLELFRHLTQHCTPVDSASSRSNGARRRRGSPGESAKPDFLFLETLKLYFLAANFLAQ